MAHDGALDGGYANVQEAVLLVNAHAVIVNVAVVAILAAIAPASVPRGAVDPAMRQEDLRYGLEEGRVKI